MSDNILYEKVDMLSLMESIEDNSKDFILLFMPTNLGGTVGKSSLRPGIDKVKAREIIKDIDSKKLSEKELGRIYNLDCSTIKEYVNTYADSREWDYGGILFFDENDFDAYMELIKKVIQNADRILKENGTLCLGIPRRLGCVGKTLKYSPDFQMLLNQAFQNVGTLLVKNYTIDENPNKQPLSFYKLFACTNGSHILPDENIGSCIFLPHEREAYRKLFNGDSYKTDDLILKFTSKRYYVDRYMKYKAIFYPELRYGTVEEMADKCALCKAPDEQRETMRKSFEMQIREISSSNYLFPLAKSLMLTYCKSGDSALFPYDRNGQYAYFADSLNINWESLYKKSITIDGRLGKDYLSKIDTRQYEVRTEVHNNKPVYYKSNMVATIEDAKLISDQLTHYSDLLSQIIQCATDNGWNDEGSIEQAVHALISLAVSGQNGRIQGDEAKKWFGEGWGQLSEQCRNYLQTAAAYEKLSEQNGNADCAPIAIEYCRALELETNSVVMKPYIDYYYKEGFQKKTYEGDYQTIDKFKKAVRKQRKSSKEGMMLGQIGTCMRNAPDSVDDKNIFYSFKKYCEENDKEQLLDVDVVGEFQLVGKIRNQSAHPSLLDKGCVSQAKQLVRAALKTQLAVETKFAHSTVLTCSVVCSPKGNKIDPNSDKMRKAVANQIEMMAQSGVKIFVLTGKFGFNQIVSDELQKYIKANANKDWGKIMVNNASDKGETSKRQKDALSKAQFCIAYYADDVDTQENDQAASVSATKAMVDDAIKEHGLIVWNAYGIE